MEKQEIMEGYEWAKGMNCAVTVCDAEGIIIYMNDKSRETYRKHGDLIGKNLYDCHSERSREIIRHLLSTGDIRQPTTPPLTLYLIFDFNTLNLPQMFDIFCNKNKIACQSSCANHKVKIIDWSTNLTKPGFFLCIQREDIASFA